MHADLDSLEAQLRVLQSSASLSQISLFVRRRVVFGPLGIVACGNRDADREAVYLALGGQRIMAS